MRRSFGPHRRDLRHLPPDHPRLLRVGQITIASGAGTRLMPDHGSGWSLSCIVAPGWPFGRPGFRPGLFGCDLGAGFASPTDDGGFEEFFEFCPALAARSAT
jgi:hypothetical protein